MARAGELVAETLALLGEHIQPGITTAELDRIAEEFIREHGGVPTSRATAASRPRPASRRTRWSSTASRATTASRRAT